VFLGLGLAGVNALGIARRNPEGVRNAVDFIAELRQAATSRPARGPPRGGHRRRQHRHRRRVQSKRLGAEAVTLVYRRGAEAMSGPTRTGLRAERGRARPSIGPRRRRARSATACCVTGVRFEHTRRSTGRQAGRQRRPYFTFCRPTCRAEGHRPGDSCPDGAAARRGDRDLCVLNCATGRIAVDAEARATSLDGVWAGGDCVGGKTDLTVQAVEPTANARRDAIDRTLRQRALRQSLSLRQAMADLRSNFVGIKSPNPFWLASAPPTDKAYNVTAPSRRAGVAWSGRRWAMDPPVVNVSSRYGAFTAPTAA
jgi:dihydropyrimidine dehydrogenase (NAD+) subunit PreT